MNKSIHELLLAYAKLGVQEWQSKPQLTKRKARSIRVPIAEHEASAARALRKPFRRSAQNRRMVLIPMPCRHKKVFAAFFAPCLDSRGWEYLSFDLVVLVQQGRAIGFRFEAGTKGHKGSHGYDHAQLSEALGRRKVKLAGALLPLPTSYPAFPIPSHDTIARFLAMAVAMHGFPEGVDDVLADAFMGRSSRMKAYWNTTVAMMTG
ncbi:MAG: hypothetical protein OXH99_05775 [Bryobacterales bacterium]|nr:hypothetical protein [Bryobacterales bacterium]